MMLMRVVVYVRHAPLIISPCGQLGQLGHLAPAGQLASALDHGDPQPVSCHVYSGLLGWVTGRAAVDRPYGGG